MTLQMPQLADSDVQHVAAMILSMNSAEAISNPAIAKQVEAQLMQLQGTEQAWGLTAGLMRHPDPIVRFYGAQNAQVKISRDWDSLPSELHSALLKQLLDLTNALAFIISSGEAQAAAGNAIVLRKLFSSLASLIVRLTPDAFPSPLLTVTTTLAGHRVPKSIILEWLTTCVHDLKRATLVEPRKSQLANAVNGEVPLVLRTIGDCLSGPASEPEVRAAFACLDAWIEWGLGAEEITSILPTIYGYLDTPLLPSAVATICEILTVSVFRDGKATRILTEPMLGWLVEKGRLIVEDAVTRRDADDERIAAIVQLIAALVDHSVTWMVGQAEDGRTRMEDPRVQAFLRVLLSLTGFPGIAGVDETLSEQVLVHYSDLQEAVVESPAFQDEYDGPAWRFARDFFSAAVTALQAKIRWPEEQLDKDDEEKFEIFRRDAGEVMVTAYYVIRQDLLASLKNQLVTQLSGLDTADWRQIEAIIFCVKSASEAVPLGEDTHLPTIFSQQVFTRLPTGVPEISSMALRMIAAYEEWFKYHPTSVGFVLEYVVAAIDDPALASLGSRVLKALCDLCRSELKQHVQAFGVLHGRIGQLQPTDQVRIVEAITSVLQALPPAESVQPVQSIVQPIVEKLALCIKMASKAPEAARQLCIQQIDALTACGKGLTPPEEDMFDLEPDATAANARAVQDARPAVQALRDAIVECVRDVLHTWPADVEIGDALSSFMKAMTASVASQTIISLPVEPLLRLIASSTGTASIWPAIGSVLVYRMAPAPGLRRQPLQDQMNGHDQTLLHVVAETAHSLITRLHALLQQQGAMSEHPDVSENHFNFMNAVNAAAAISCDASLTMPHGRSQIVAKFPGAILLLPGETQQRAMHLAVLGLTAQERFTLKGAIEFLVAILNTSRHAPSVAEAFLPLILATGPDYIRATIAGAALHSPRSTIPNFAELLVASVVRIPDETRDWVVQALSHDGFPGGKETPQAKKKFQDMLLRTRTPKKMREALHDFALVCRGIADTTYGAATME